MSLSLIDRGKRFGKGGRLEFKISFCGLTGLKLWQVSADKCVSQNVSNGGWNVGGGGAGRVGSERNQCPKLVSRKVFEHGSCPTHQCLPEKLKHVVFTDVLSQTEDLQIAVERFNIARQLPLFV